MYNNIKYLIMGETALTMEFGNTISKEINRRIRRTLKMIEASELGKRVECIPTYRSITIFYDPIDLPYSLLLEKLQQFENMAVEEEEDEHRLIEIPTLYGKDYGPDLFYVAQHGGMDEEEVIAIHSGRDYLVYMLGFSPGFLYLGGMDERIFTPRLSTPRSAIPAGSVGIAGMQTGIYPSESPGGWQLIGRTPLKLYDETREPPVFVEAGDYIRYVPIDEQEFLRIQAEVEKGIYQVSIRKINEGDLHGQD